jgi:hypothetical protein
MSYEPALAGEIPADGVLETLRAIEARRISGRLRFTATDDEGVIERGEVELVAGQLALSQPPLPGGADPVERLLVLRRGHFVVHQHLPPLPVSQGDEQRRRGSLAVHAPTDLMGYCERAGLTGTLRLTHEGSLVEMVYEAGELLGIRVDGRESAELGPVFSWEEGRFEIGLAEDVRALLDGPEPEDPSEREPTTQFVRPRPNDTGRHFLRVLELALSDIVERRERAPHKGRGQTAASPPPSVRPRPPSEAPPPRRARGDATVRLMILAPAAASCPADAPRKDAPVTEPSAPSSAPAASPDAPASAGASPAAPGSPASTAGWMLAVLALGVLILALLARLAP